MKSKKRIFSVIAATLSITALLFISSPERSDADTGKKSLSKITSVDLEKVCMVTDNVLDKPLIPVEVDGKTYYGCCPGCKSQLENDREVRYSKDPVSGNEVDKALAFVLEGKKGEALYFESIETAISYSDK